MHIDDDILEFMEDLEEDQDLRKNVRIYKKHIKSDKNDNLMDTEDPTLNYNIGINVPTRTNDTNNTKPTLTNNVDYTVDDDCYPTISLDEMLNDLTLD